MPQRIASHRPTSFSVPGLFYIEPSTALSGASIIGAPDWSVFRADDDEGLPEWTEAEIVFLHWRLLKDVQALADPDTPLEDKLATVRWVFTESDKDDRPFSFVNCLRVVGCSPLSPIPYCGRVDIEEIREHIARNLPRWLRASLARYPAWVADALARNPAWIDAQLAKNPQWINEQIKAMSERGDLFA